MAELRRNLKRNGIEVYFPQKPDFDIISWLKDHKFRWGRTAGVWWKIYDEDDWREVHEYFGIPLPEHQEPSEDQTKQDEVEIVPAKFPSEVGDIDKTMAMINKAIEERPSRRTHGNTANNAFFIVGDKIVQWNKLYKETTPNQRKNAIGVHSHSPENWTEGESFQPLNAMDIEAWIKLMVKNDATGRIVIIMADGRAEAIEITNKTEPEFFKLRKKRLIEALSPNYELRSQYFDKNKHMPGYDTNGLEREWLRAFAKKYKLMYYENLKWNKPEMKTERPSAWITEKSVFDDLITSLAKKHNVSYSSIEEQLDLGTQIELEHTKDIKETWRIAYDHLWEDPEYYTKAKPANWAAKEIKKEQETVRTRIPDEEVKYKSSALKRLVDDYNNAKDDFDRNRVISDFAYNYAGPSKAVARQTILSELMGSKVPKSKAGIHKIEEMAKKWLSALEIGAAKKEQKPEFFKDVSVIAPEKDIEPQPKSNLTKDEILERLKEMARKSKSDLDFVNATKFLSSNFGLDNTSDDFVEVLGLKRGDPDYNLKQLKHFYRTQGLHAKKEHKEKVTNEKAEWDVARIEDMANEAMRESEQEALESGVGEIRPSFLKKDILLGREIQLSMPNGEKRRGQFAIVELVNIIASHNEDNFHSEPLYPKNADGNNINDRNYKDDPAAQKAVMDYARELEPERLITTSRTPSGTPIITKDGFVVSGNNRTMSLKLAAKNYPENYKEYVKYLAEEIESFGFDQRIIEPLIKNDFIPVAKTDNKNAHFIKFTNPVLVRIDYDFPAYTTQELSKYNKDTKKAERPVDKAIKLSNILRENTRCAEIIAETTGDFDTFSEFYLSVSAQKKLAKTLVECNLLTSQELPAYFSETVFTETGKEFIENLLAALVLTREALLASEQPGVKSIKQRLITALPVLMKNASLPEGSLIQNINDAVTLQHKIKTSGSEFVDWIRQQNLFGERYDSKTVYLNRLIETGKIKFKQAIEAYNSAVMQNQGASLFGEKPSLETIFDHYIKGAVDQVEQRLIENSDLVSKGENKKSIIPEFDMNGNKILSASEWNALTKEEQEKISGTITAPVTTPDGNTFNADKGLAPYLQRIINLGLATGQSDSGMVGDHPNYRHVETGELLYPTIGGTGAYLTFWKPEAKGVSDLGRNINTQEQIDIIRKVAKEVGLIPYDGQVFFQPSLGVNFPATNDGSWRQDILKEANILLNQEHPEFNSKGNDHPSDRFMEWLDLRNDVYEPIVEKKHGGVRFYTDEEIAELWEKFVSGLEREIKKDIQPELTLENISKALSGTDFFTKPDSEDAKLIIKATAAGYVVRQSVSQAHWTPYGIDTFKKQPTFKENTPIAEAKAASENLDKIRKEFLRFTDDEKPEDRLKIYLVDGNKVRQDHIEFTMGGHGYVYDYVPIDEIWIDENLKSKPDDMEAVIKHEVFEVRKMRDEGLTYDQAHELANKIETKERNKEPMEPQKKLNPYIALFGSKQYELHAENLYDAKKKAIEHFKPAKSKEHLVSVHLAVEEEEKPEPIKSPILDVFLPKIKIIQPFTPQPQIDALVRMYRSEEREGAIEIATRLAGIIENMPKTYQTEKIKTPDKIVYLHYFSTGGNSDWYIVEKDSNPDQNQMFGYAILNGDTINAEWGYVSAQEIKATGLAVELDFYWEPKPFKEISILGVSDVHKDEIKDEGYGTGTQFNDRTDDKERKIFGYSFMFQPANEEGIELMKALQGFGIIIGVLEYPNGLSIEYHARKYELIDNSGEFKINEVGKEGYPEVIEFKNDDGKLMSVFNLAKEIENVILKLSKQSEKQPKAKSSSQEFFKGEYVKFLPEYQEEGEMGVFEVMDDSEGHGRVNVSPVDWSGEIRPLELVRTYMLTKVNKPKALPRVKDGDKEYFVDFKLQELRDVHTAEPVPFTVVGKVNPELAAKLRGIRAESGPNVFMEGLDEPEIKLTDEQKKSINEAWEAIQNIAASDERFGVGDLIIPYALNYQKGNKRFLITEVYVNDAGEESYKGKFETENKEYDLIRNSKDKLVKKAGTWKTDIIVGHSGPKNPISVSKTAISVSKSDYKNEFDLNKAIESLIDKKWNDPADKWSGEELEFIKAYTGYGGLDEEAKEAGSSLNVGSLYEFYTPDKVIEKMWGLAYKYGYKEGRLIEPSVGPGLFLKREYVKSHVIKDAYEINRYSAKICKLLYPEVNVNDGAETKYFEQLFIKNNYTVRDKIKPVHELVIGNPPYGEASGMYMGMGEKIYTHAKNYIDYFIFRGLDLLIPGGLLIYIIGAEVAAGGVPWLDQGNSKCKDAIAKKGKLIDAYRLPEGLFARTNVVSDIVCFRKK